MGMTEQMMTADEFRNWLQTTTAESGEITVATPAAHKVIAHLMDVAGWKYEYHNHYKDATTTIRFQRNKTTRDAIRASAAKHAKPVPNPDYFDLHARVVTTEHPDGVDGELLDRMLSTVTLTYPDMDRVAAIPEAASPARDRLVACGGNIHEAVRVRRAEQQRPVRAARSPALVALSGFWLGFAVIFALLAAFHLGTGQQFSDGWYDLATSVIAMFMWKAIGSSAKRKR